MKKKSFYYCDLRKFNYFYSKQKFAIEWTPLNEKRDKKIHID